MFLFCTMASSTVVTLLQPVSEMRARKEMRSALFI